MDTFAGTAWSVVGAQGVARWDEPAGDWVVHQLPYVCAAGTGVIGIHGVIVGGRFDKARAHESEWGGLVVAVVGVEEVVEVWWSELNMKKA